LIEKGNVMTHANRRRESLWSDRRGLTTVEYIIVLGLIAVVGIAAWQQFGETLTGEIEAAEGYIADVVQFFGSQAVRPVRWPDPSASNLVVLTNV
jgi:Flp pilus assembly pilin Flp